MDNIDAFDEIHEELEQDTSPAEQVAVAVFVYSLASNRWVNAATGRFVSTVEVTNELRRHVAATFNTLDGLTNQLYNGGLTMEQWQVAVASELKDAHLAQSMFSRGGKHNMSAVEYGRVGGTLADEYRYLSAFADDIAAGKVSQAQALARIKQYGKAAQQSYWREYDLATPDDEVIWWVLHPAEHCDGCLTLAFGSPYESGELHTHPGAGDTECKGNCNCTEERRKRVA